jgi:uncharacterized protein (TIGR02145 family)
MREIRKALVYMFILMGMISMLAISCKKDTETLVSGTVTDIDGNIYHTVVIGGQLWMVENLKTTKYNDGTAIQELTDNTEWKSDSAGAFCWYNNDLATNGSTYGALYNWQVINTGKLCPTGWHVPTNSEWAQLIDYLGGDSIACDMLKDNSGMYWTYSAKDTFSSNETGFTALPGGYRDLKGTFSKINNIGIWWASTSFDVYTSATSKLSYAYLFSLNKDSVNVTIGANRLNMGFSVRCVRD